MQPVKQRILEMVDTALYHIMPKEVLANNSGAQETSAVNPDETAHQKAPDIPQWVAKSPPQKRGSALFKLVSILGTRFCISIPETIILADDLICHRNAGRSQSVRNTHRTSNDDEALRMAITPTSRACFRSAESTASILAVSHIASNGFRCLCD